MTEIEEKKHQLYGHHYELVDVSMSICFPRLIFHDQYIYTDCILFPIVPFGLTVYSHRR